MLAKEHKVVTVDGLLVV